MVIVEDAELVQLADIVKRENDIVERLHRLTLGRADDVDRRSGRALHQSDAPRKPSNEQRLSVFTRNIDERLLESPLVRCRLVEAKQIDDNENLPRFQNERRSLERRSVQLLALIVFNRPFDDSDHELRRLHPDIIRRIEKIAEKALGGFDAFSVGDDFAGENPSRVIVSSPERLPLLIGFFNARGLFARINHSRPSKLPRACSSPPTLRFSKALASNFASPRGVRPSASA